MSKIKIYLLAGLLCLTSLNVYSQQGNRSTVSVNHSSDNIFTHIVETGQTVYSIATMYGVTVDDIYRLNPDSREVLKIGAVLRIPQAIKETIATPAQEDHYIYHTIQAKETLYSLSLKYEVPGTIILDANPGLSVATFQIGKTIRIPINMLEDIPMSEFVTVTRWIDYKVPKRETLYNISRKFNVSREELISINPELRDGFKENMILKIPVITDEMVQSSTQATVRERDVNALLTAPRHADRIDIIKVALLLPFMTNEPVPSANTSRFIEYYEGLLLAVDSLRNQGVSIELSVFDTGEGTAKLQQILRDRALFDANLIIGAVQNEQIKPVAEFAQQYNKKYVIPFTSRNDDVLSNASIFQVNTPQSYLYAKASQTVINLFSSYNIVFVDTQDKENKTDFIQTVQNDLQQRNIPFKQLPYKDASFEKDLKAQLTTDKRNVIIPLSGSQETLNKLRIPLRLLAENASEYRINMFGYPEWQTYGLEVINDLHALDTYIYSNFYTDNSSRDVRE